MKLINSSDAGKNTFFCCFNCNITEKICIFTYLWFQQGTNRRRKRIRETETFDVTTKCKCKCNWSLTAKQQFMRYINFKIYPNLLLGSCNVTIDRWGQGWRKGSLLFNAAKENTRKVNSFSSQTGSFHAGCDRNAPWHQHSSYRACLHLSALILSCCQS